MIVSERPVKVPDSEDATLFVVIQEEPTKMAIRREGGGLVQVEPGEVPGLITELMESYVAMLVMKFS